MNAPDFWRHHGPLAQLLSPIGAVYGVFAARRLNRNAPLAGLPAIVVGGLTVGGDGKTPTVIAIAERLKALGERPALITRGYGGRLRHETVIVDVRRHDADAVGDEALLLARTATTIVGADRLKSVDAARALGASVVVLDDGFQSRRLAPDLAVLAIDADYGAGNERCLPAGPLRAPLDAQLAAADLLVVVGDGPRADALARRAGKPIVTARRHVACSALVGVRVVAFSGIARPESFHRSLKETGAEIVASRQFGDHHRFTPRDIAALKLLLDEHDARLVTTEKDAVRLGARMQELDILALPLHLEFEDASALDEVMRRLRR